jgi:hypothetical protein
MVEDSGLCRSRRPRVVVDGDRMEELGEDRAGDPCRALLDQPHAEVDVAEELALVGGEEERPAIELAHPAHVVE